jgi:hypothetical protein
MCKLSFSVCNVLVFLVSINPTFSAVFTWCEISQTMVQEGQCGSMPFAPANMGVTFDIRAIRDIKPNLDKSAPEGAFIISVMKDRPAERSGILGGDIITNINEIIIKKGGDLPIVIRSFKPGNSIVVKAWRPSVNKEFIYTVILSDGDGNVPITNLKVTTPPPVTVEATPTAPARVAAIANVELPVKAPVGQAIPNQPTQVTTNPIDQVKKTSANEVWISFNPSITIQQRQFCRIVENFRTENALAIQSRNQIKVNETFRSLSQSLNSLLPDGKFQGWVMRTVSVDQASDGSAEVLLEMPCNIYVGSNACDANPSNYYGTAPEGSRMYTELAKMTVGDFVLTNGQFVYTDDKAFDKTRSVASFRYMRTAAHCKAKEVAADTEFFGIKLDVISTIK